MDTPLPAKCLPDWALPFLDEWRSGSRLIPVTIDDEMDHRRAAFYRLYTANDVDVCAMWRHAGVCIAPEWRNAFLQTLIIATDAVIPDKPLPVYGSPKKNPPRLRTREQRHARKLAELLQLLRVVTPPRCKANQSRILNVGSDIEALIIWFDIGQVPYNYDLRWSKTELGIEFTTDSKRGWMQHRRASDLVRAKTIKTARTLATLPGATKRASWLVLLADELATLPSMDIECGGDIELRSQKAGYQDWLRYTYCETLNYAAVAGNPLLRMSDWATLARVVADAPDPSPDTIAHLLANLRC